MSLSANTVENIVSDKKKKMHVFLIVYNLEHFKLAELIQTSNMIVLLQMASKTGGRGIL